MLFLIHEFALCLYLFSLQRNGIRRTNQMSIAPDLSADISLWRWPLFMEFVYKSGFSLSTMRREKQKDYICVSVGRARNSIIIWIFCCSTTPTCYSNANSHIYKQWKWSLKFHLYSIWEWFFFFQAVVKLSFCLVHLIRSVIHVYLFIKIDENGAKITMNLMENRTVLCTN